MTANIASRIATTILLPWKMELFGVWSSLIHLSLTWPRAGAIHAASI
ncbi:MAG: hypothetical protein R3A46_17205 [Thermomicrobiales bacterium]